MSPTGDSLLHTAAWHGQTPSVQLLLARLHPVGHAARNRSAPLHYAAWQGHTEVAQAGFDLTFREALNLLYSRLSCRLQGGIARVSWFSSFKNVREKVPQVARQALIEGQANLEQRMVGGDTPIHQALSPLMRA